MINPRRGWRSLPKIFVSSNFAAVFKVESASMYIMNPPSFIPTHSLLLKSHHSYRSYEYWHAVHFALFTWTWTIMYQQGLNKYSMPIFVRMPIYFDTFFFGSKFNLILTIYIRWGAAGKGHRATQGKGSWQKITAPSISKIMDHDQKMKKKIIKIRIFFLDI